MKIFISIVFLTVSLSLLSQNTKIDSLQQKLKQSKGAERITVLNDFAYAYGYVDFNKSISLAKEALYLAETLKYNKAKALTYDILGRAYFISGNNKVAEEYYNKCLSIAKKYGNEDDIYKALRHKTIIYLNGYITNSSELIPVFKRYIKMTIEKNNYVDFQEGLKSFIYVSHAQQFNDIITQYLSELNECKNKNSEFKSAIFASEAFNYEMNLNYFKAIEKYTIARKVTLVALNKINCLERIGVVYFSVRRYKESIRYYNEALQFFKSNKIEQPNCLLYLLEFDLGASYLQLNENRRAISCFKTALQWSGFCNRDKGALLGNLGQAYLAIGDLNNADYYINKSISIFDNLQDKSMILGSLHSKAKLQIRKQQWNNLNLTINNISNLVDSVKDYYIIYDSYKLLSDYYEKSGDYKRSNKYLKKWITANDSINNRELATKMKEFEFKYETEKKEQQIALQQDIIKNKNQLLVFLVISGSLILGALLVIFILYRIRNKAYKQLVYQSLENTSYAQPMEIEDNTDEENAVEIKNGNSSLDDGLKNQIEIALNKQLDAKAYLESNLILKILAEKCDTNRSYLSQFINEQYNMNFNTFINTLRINEAKKNLSDINNDIPLKELYLQLGFNTYSVFNEAFKKHVGVTPAFFLKTVKGLYSVSNPNKIQ